MNLKTMARRIRALEETIEDLRVLIRRLEAVAEEE